MYFYFILIDIVTARKKTVFQCPSFNFSLYICAGTEHENAHNAVNHQWASYLIPHDLTLFQNFKVLNALQFSSTFRTRTPYCADVLLCCLSLVRIQSYLRIIISLELSVLLTNLLGCIPQVRFSRFFIRTSLPGAGASLGFPVIGSE